MAGGTRWDSNEDAMLDAMWPREDLFVSDIADALHRTAPAIRRHATTRRLGARPRTIKSKVVRQWTDEEVIKLRRLACEGRMRGYIAERLGRRVESVLAKAKECGIEILAHQDWSESEMDHLRRLVAVERLDNKTIFTILFPRTPHAILSKIMSLSLSKVRKEPRPVVEVAVEVPSSESEAASTEPAPLWTAPPKTDWPAPVFGPAPTCQYPLWGNIPVPRPATFCGKTSFRDSFCDEHWLRCHEPRAKMGDAT